MCLPAHFPFLQLPQPHSPGRRCGFAVTSGQPGAWGYPFECHLKNSPSCPPPMGLVSRKQPMVPTETSTWLSGAGAACPLWSHMWVLAQWVGSVPQSPRPGVARAVLWGRTRGLGGGRGCLQDLCIPPSSTWWAWASWPEAEGPLSPGAPQLYPVLGEMGKWMCGRVKLVLQRHRWEVT